MKIKEILGESARAIGLNAMNMNYALRKTTPEDQALKDRIRQSAKKEIEDIQAKLSAAIEKEDWDLVDDLEKHLKLKIAVLSQSLLYMKGK